MLREVGCLGEDTGQSDASAGGVSRDGGGVGSILSPTSEKEVETLVTGFI